MERKEEGSLLKSHGNARDEGVCSIQECKFAVKPSWDFPSLTFRKSLDDSGMGGNTSVKWPWPEQELFLCRDLLQIFSNLEEVCY